MLYDLQPVEKKTAPLSRPVEKMQQAYRGIMTKLLKKRGLVMLASVALLLFSFFIARFLRVEMMAEDDQGQISITAEVKPGMKIDKVDRVMKQIEDIISQQEDVESYITLAGSSGLSMSSDPSITVYLKKDRKWRQTRWSVSGNSSWAESQIPI